MPNREATEEELSATSSHGTRVVSPEAAAVAAARSRPAARGHLVTGNPRYQDHVVAASVTLPPADVSPIVVVS